MQKKTRKETLLRHPIPITPTLPPSPADLTCLWIYSTFLICAVDPYTERARLAI